MKLYLSALGIPDTKAYLSLFGKKQPRTVAIIPTAWHVASKEKRQLFLDKAIKQFDALDFAYEFVELEDYDHKEKELHTTLAKFSGVWVLGGNTFYLNYWMRESGFDTIIGDLLADGFVYGGESAGAVVAGKTLHGIELLDDPNEAPDTIWAGLGFVPYGIIPHWGRQKYAGRIEQTYDEMQLFGAVKTLTDEQFIALS